MNNTEYLISMAYDSLGYAPIKGFSNYLISMNGDVYSIFTKKYLAKIKHSHGYLFVAIKGDDGKRYNKYIHRLVAEVYIPNRDNKPFVNHKDGNKHNNRIDNLEWCTNSENMIHAVNNGMRKTGLNHYKCTVVVDNLGNKYSLSQAAKISNISHQYLSKMLSGKAINKTQFTKL